MEPGQEYYREFQTLCPMEGHQLHRTGGIAFSGGPAQIPLLALDQGVSEIRQGIMEGGHIRQPVQGGAGAVGLGPILKQLAGFVPV